MADERCETCRFWDHDGKDTWECDHGGKPLPGASHTSNCRRYPPILRTYHDSAEDRNFLAGFPLTRDWDWCGEYRPREPPAPDPGPPAFAPDPPA